MRFFSQNKKILECSETKKYAKKNIFLQNHPFRAFLASKTYIFIHVKKNLRHKIERPLTARGGWSMPLRTRPLRMQVFDLTCSVVFPAKLSRDAVTNGGRITRNPAYTGWYRISYPTSIFDMPEDFLPVPLPLRVQRKDVRLADVAARAAIKALAESAVKAALAMGQREKLNNLPTNFSLFFLFLAKNKIIFEKTILFLS